MQKSFLEEVVEQLWQKDPEIAQLTFVLPSKRAGIFLKNHIAKITRSTTFAPQIFSIEEFVSKLAGLAYATPTQQLFELYQVYLRETKGEKDDFYVFAKWGTTLLQDFTEIDRYLIDPKEIFSYLSAINEINHWSLQKEKTKMIQDYIHFWNNLENLYHAFNKRLMQQGIGHQGLVYRKACEQLPSFIKEHEQHTHIFIGFNALNTAETFIIHEILQQTAAEIYWDIDPYFIKDPIHDAGYFIRQHLKNWDYYKTQPIPDLKENYRKPKNINVIGVSKNVAQAQYVGTLLKSLETHPETTRQTAVILGDETLLNPLLNAIPEDLNGVNITMGYPLAKTPLASLFLGFFKMTMSKKEGAWFYQDVQAMLSHPYIRVLLKISDKNYAHLLSSTITAKNWVYINLSKIQAVFNDHPNSFEVLFSESLDTPIQVIEKCQEIIAKLKHIFEQDENRLALSYLLKFHELFNQITTLTREHTFIDNIKTLQSIYTTILSSETLDFMGEPLKGIQIMGMLESRNLDFETIILTAVNEGILPSGKSNNSFIPFEVKHRFGLPTYKEKDAVYTYHFYRLLQRAKNVYIIYNTEPDVLTGGEKSRLITQLLLDENRVPPIQQILAAPKIQSAHPEIQKIPKDTHLINLIRRIAAKGFSPSSLSNYIRNPIVFYKQHVLGIQDTEAVEEHIAANTFGTIVHDTLEELYTPLLNKFLTQENLEALKPKIKTTAQKQFLRTYGNADISHGKNFIAFHVIVRYIENFITLEIREVAQHRIKLLALEQSLHCTLDIPEINFPIALKGKLDRVDQKDGVLRILDYKTGRVSSHQVKVSSWNLIATDYGYNKPFQLLCYALMYTATYKSKALEAGIISFKNLKEGVLLFKAKETEEGKVFTTQITSTILDRFKQELKTLLIEICTMETPFLEKEI